MDNFVPIDESTQGYQGPEANIKIFGYGSVGSLMVGFTLDQDVKLFRHLFQLVVDTLDLSLGYSDTAFDAINH
jgi:hypothetical protein